MVRATALTGRAVCVVVVCPFVSQLQHRYAELSNFSAKSLSEDITKEVFSRCLSQVASKCVGMGEMRVLIAIDGADRVQVCLLSSVKCMQHTLTHTKYPVTVSLSSLVC